MRLLRGLLNWLESFRGEMTSLVAVVTFLAFVYAAIGLANSSRNRWEDMSIQLENSPGSTTAEAARKQASTDFHNWYGSILMISSIAEIILAALWLNALRKVAPASADLALTTIAVIIGHVFSYCTYRHETFEILREHGTYFAFMPIKWVLGGHP